MAKIEFTGLDDIQRSITELGEKADIIVDKMLNAGGYVVKEEFKYQAENKGHILTGSLRNKIGYSSPRTSNDERYTIVGPRGTDKKKTSNALKGYVLNYGSAVRGIQGSAWFDWGIEHVEPKVEESMRRVFEEEIDKIMED